MAPGPGLTGSQRRSQSRAGSHVSSSSETEADDLLGTATNRDAPEPANIAAERGRLLSPAKKLTLNQSLLGFKHRFSSNVIPNSLSTSTSTSNASTQSLTSDGPRPPSPTPRLSPARGPTLRQSLLKPLPQTPYEPSLGLLPAVGRQEEEDSGENHADSQTSDSRMNSRSSTMDSSSSAAAAQIYGGHEHYNRDTNSSMSSLASSFRHEAGDDIRDDPASKSTGGPASSIPSPAFGHGGRPGGPAAANAMPGSSTHLSGLMCNVHRTTGHEPPPLVGATTSILGDKLYVFGGRILSRSRPAPLTSDLYQLDLVSRHWSRLETGGDIPPPRYFHSMCALGDTKMVCYGGMSPSTNSNQPTTSADPQQQPEVSVMSDIHVYDVETRTWTYLPAQDAPQGRYAHCACILPSSASFSSSRAPLAALQHNPSSSHPNEGRIGINIDGSGGAEMVIVGGQDGANHYIEQISVFNLRSLKWTSTQPLGKSCGAYRSVAAPLPPSVSAKLGKSFLNGNGSNNNNNNNNNNQHHHEARDAGSSMLIYSNYNFLDVKLELQIRSPDGHLTERPMTGTFSPPGLRFPNGSVIDTHFVVSGTYLTSSKQEYALWSLDLRTLTWSRIDAGGSVFSQGSWNRGVLWNRHNTFVILGNRKRNLVDDYNHRRINFSNVCMVELEAFGFYDNPRKMSPMSGFVSASSPYSGTSLSLARKAGCTAGGRSHSRASEELGEKALAMRELADMDILCIGGERIPVNSRVVSRRWGPYFVQLLREGTATQDGSDSATLRSGLASNPLRASALTITPSSKDATQAPSSASAGRRTSLLSVSTAGTATNTGAEASGDGASVGSLGDAAGRGSAETDPAAINAAPTPASLPPNTRPRCLYLPHTYLTVKALLHFLYTSSLPPPTSALCTPQILCSLLQIARPYRVDGLLEAVVERLHGLLDSRNAAAVFNATAMAAGGGRGIDGSLNPNFYVKSSDPVGSPTSVSDFSLLSGATANDSSSDLAATTAGLSIKANTGVQRDGRPASGETSASTSASGSEWGSEVGGSDRDRERDRDRDRDRDGGPIWSGELSSVIGLQKRGLRGLMEGRRMRERTGTGSLGGGTAPAGNGSFTLGQPGLGGGQRVGLGIAGSQ